MSAPVVRAVGLHTGWGRGVAAIPTDARAAAGGRAVVSLGRAEAAAPFLAEERFRRTTRDCRWALASVSAMLEDGGAGPEAITGERTALVYVTAAAYGASNRAFIEGGRGGTHFAYTAPAVVPAETAIGFGLSGPSAIFIGGPPATLRAIWHAATLLDAGVCDRALVLAVETFDECADLYARAQRITGRPLVEAAGCVWLERGEGELVLGQHRRAERHLVDATKRRVGETFACEPLATLALWRHAGASTPLALTGRWRGEVADLRWEPSSMTLAKASAR